MRYNVYYNNLLGADIMSNTIAVVDIGSNSVRLMLSRGGQSVSKQVTITKLAEGSAITAILSQAAIDRTARAVIGYINQARVLTDKIYAFATEAVRRAYNKADLLQAVRAATGVEIDIISGDVEAAIGYLGATDGRCGLYTVIDIGGASTELVVGDNGSIIYAKSLPIGAVKLTELSGGSRVLAESIAQDHIKLLDCDKLRSGKLIGISGTVTTLSSINLNMEYYDSNVVHNSTLTAQQVADITDRLYGCDLSERTKIVGLQAGRAEVIPAGASILMEVIRALGVRELTVSESDNLEGYLITKNNA